MAEWPTIPFNSSSGFVFIYLYLFEIKTSQRHQHAEIHCFILVEYKTNEESDTRNPHPKSVYSQGFIYTSFVGYYSLFNGLFYSQLCIWVQKNSKDIFVFHYVLILDTLRSNYEIKLT